ncbi:MAG: hypothetical protein ABIQ72_10155 [Usitatibacter sp.]
MKTRTTLFATTLAAAMMLPFAASATSTFHPANNEAGTVNHVVAGTLSRAERDAIEKADAQRANSAWTYTGGEGGWELRQHSYALRAGKVIHTDDIAHDTPRPVAGGSPTLNGG